MKTLIKGFGLYTEKDLEARGMSRRTSWLQPNLTCDSQWGSHSNIIWCALEASRVRAHGTRASIALDDETGTIALFAQGAFLESEPEAANA